MEDGVYPCLVFSREPSSDKNCVILEIKDVNDIKDTDMEWISHDCKNITSNLRPICEYPYKGFELNLDNVEGNRKTG